MNPESALLATSTATQRSGTTMLSFDPDVMAVALQGVTLEHVQLGPGVFRGQIAHTASADIRVDWGRYGLSALSRGDLSTDMVTLMLSIGGNGDWLAHGQRAVTGDMALFPERGELLMAMPPQAHWLSIQVPRHRLELAGLSMQRYFTGSARRMPGVVHAGLQQALDALAPALAASSVSAGLGDAEINQAHNELLSVLLSELVHRGGASDAGVPISPGERWRVIRRAEEFLQGNDSPAVRIDDLCVAACTSLSRLERAFRESFGVSPRRFLTMRRLAEVRSELLRGAPDASVTEIATRWGFFHLGQFSKEYRALYAERPSDTLRASRGVVLSGFSGN
jgi:AraC family ethanolamine operon transcriptional activator